jgi:tRNA(His) guanylyltransferase
MDARLTRCMVKTTIDLVEKFNAITGYHQSDEISIVFAAANSPEEIAAKAEAEACEPAKKKQRNKKQLKNHPYNGRVQKLASVAASYASSRLNYHLMHEGIRSSLIEKIGVGWKR